MAEDICFLQKDVLIIKAPKRSPVLLRTIVLLFAIVFGLYICSICAKQSDTHRKNRFLDLEVFPRPCSKQVCIKSELPYLHYPNPETFSRAECACNPVRYFAIISMQRCGTGWFETLVNSHTNVSSSGEIFSVKDRRANMSSIEQTLDKVYNLDWFNSASKNHCSAAVGFKWMLNQGLMAHHNEIAEYFNRRGVSVIFLFRRNLLRRMVSVLANSHDRFAKTLNGTHKAHVHSPAEAETLSKYKPTINSTSLLNDLKEMEEAGAKALDSLRSTRHIVLYYEDLVKNQTKLTEVQEFLGIPVMNLTSRQLKIHNGPLSEHVMNWEDVKKTLQGTTYEILLNTDY